MNRQVCNYSNSELLSTYCDRLLKAGGDKLSEEEVESNMER